MSGQKRRQDRHAGFSPAARARSRLSAIRRKPGDRLRDMIWAAVTPSPFGRQVASRAVLGFLSM